MKVRCHGMDRGGFTTCGIIAVRCERRPLDGEVVVARLGNQMTLKCFRRRAADTFELRPESSDLEHKPIGVEPDAEDFRIAGVVIGVRRTESPHEALEVA